MAISMKNRFPNIFVPLALIFAIAVIKQVFAGSCTISQHKFKNDTILVNTRCKVRCYETTFYAGSTAMCILKHRGFGYVFTILTGRCFNGVCQETDDGEIYKRELKDPLLDIYNPQDRETWRLKCHFTNVQDKEGKVFLSTNCSVCCKDGTVKTRSDRTPCILSKVYSGDYYANITVGQCENGTCVSDGNYNKIQVERELLESRNEESDNIPCK
uniref:Putative secreted protein n=1 Tax=Ixodes ricinus TaxID=34613 RepID=A0A0K8R807_IXORI